MNSKLLKIALNLTHVRMHHRSSPMGQNWIFRVIDWSVGLVVVTLL